MSDDPKDAWIVEEYSDDIDAFKAFKRNEDLVNELAEEKRKLAVNNEHWGRVADRHAELSEAISAVRGDLYINLAAHKYWPIAKAMGWDVSELRDEYNGSSLWC